MPKLSIITINYNNDIGLKRTIKSVLSQIYADFEYIIIDGVSTDDSVALIKEFADKITYWISEPDKGIYNAMNKGILKATGDYCLFLNSGDCLANDRVLEEVVLNGLDTDIISGNAIYEASEFHEGKYVFSPERIKASDIIINFLPHQSSFIRRNLFNEIHSYDESFTVVSDWAFFIEALLVYSKSYKHINLFVSVCDTGGISSNPENCQMMKDEFHLALKKILPAYYDDYAELRNFRSFENNARNAILAKVGKSFMFKVLLAIRKRLLKYGFYDLKASMKRKKYHRALDKDDALKKKDIEQQIYKMKGPLFVKNNNTDDIIVSLTSYAERVTNSLPYSLYSLFTQTKLPNRIILFLDNITWNNNNLPPIIKHFKSLGLEVMFCEDYRSYKKLIPALKLFPNNPIITVDDDIYYDSKLIENLVEEYSMSDKKTVICHWACIQEERNGSFIPYSQWQDSQYGNEYSMYSPFGGDGTLYPPHIFDAEIFNDKVFMLLAPSADDMWFWLMEYRCSVNVKLMKNALELKNLNVNQVNLLEEKNSTALYFQNCVHGQNDIQFEKLLEYYNLS